MTIAPVRDTLADHLITPENAALPPIDCQPSPLAAVVLAIAEKWRPHRSLAASYQFSAAFEAAEAPPVARLGSAGA
jgi:3-methyladenine DNA glycosylase/8-oxoguanine DNA glycosylase